MIRKTPNHSLQDILGICREWSICQNVPGVKKARGRERIALKHLALKCCELGFANEVHEKDRDNFFSLGTSMLHHLIDSDDAKSLIAIKNQCLSIGNLAWAWKVLYVLLELTATADEALIESLKLELPKHEALSRDGIILCVLSNEALPSLLPSTKKALRDMVLANQVPFTTNSNAKQAMALARQYS